MKDLWMDPVVMGATGVIVVGFILLVLAVRALRKSSKPKPIKEFDFPSLINDEPLSVISPTTNPFSKGPATPPAHAPAPVAVNKDVLDKVDLISQRLVDMQMLLNRQVAVSSQSGGSPQGLSPEMLDKLLKIASTVAQHIEVLQKALGGTPTASAPAPTPIAPAAAPANAAPPPTIKLVDVPPPSSVKPVSQMFGNAGKTPPPANP